MAVAEREGLDEHFKLSTSISINNMHLFDARGRIKKFGGPLEIVDEFFPTR